MKITVSTVVGADLASTWSAWNTPEDINAWNAASEEWRCTGSRVDLRPGGTFSSRMEARDGSMGFEFSGTYTKVVDHERIDYVINDGRCVSIVFQAVGNGVKVTETFVAEGQHDPEFQRAGWQAILDNFARHVASKA